MRRWRKSPARRCGRATICSISSILTATGAASSKPTAMLEADYIFAHVLLGTGDPGKMQRAMNEILRYQNDDGGWSIYPGGPSNISLSVKCYLAGKLMGMSPDEPAMAQGAGVDSGPWRGGRV